jgi:hypothetical protein
VKLKKKLRVSERFGLMKKKVSLTVDRRVPIGSPGGGTPASRKVLGVALCMLELKESLRIKGVDCPSPVGKDPLGKSKSDCS